jgi:hypothetical protein
MSSLGYVAYGGQAKICEVAIFESSHFGNRKVNGLLRGGHSTVCLCRNPGTG